MQTFTHCSKYQDFQFCVSQIQVKFGLTQWQKEIQKSWLVIPEIRKSIHDEVRFS